MGPGDNDIKDEKKRSPKLIIPINPERKTNPFIVAPLTQGSTPQGFFHDWVNSEEYKRRVESNEYSDPDSTIRNRSRNIERSDISFSDAVSVAAPGSKYGTTNNVNINKGDAAKYGSNVVVPHELGHLIGGSFPGQYDSSMSEFEKILLDSSNINKSSNTHDAIAPEMKSDLDSNRYNLFKSNIFDIKKGESFTKEHLNKAKETLKNDETFNRLIKQTGDENYIKLMNTIASNKEPAHSRIFNRSVSEVINPPGKPMPEGLMKTGIKA